MKNKLPVIIIILIAVIVGAIYLINPDVLKLGQGNLNNLEDLEQPIVFNPALCDEVVTYKSDGTLERRFPDNHEQIVSYCKAEFPDLNL